MLCCQGGWYQPSVHEEWASKDNAAGLMIKGEEKRDALDGDTVQSMPHKSGFAFSHPGEMTSTVRSIVSDAAMVAALSDSSRCDNASVV
jgi:hypothetical protein